MQTYISHDLIADQGSFGSVMERLFISSSGVALKIHEHDPLWVETIQKHVCLKSQYEESGELELGRRPAGSPQTWPFELDFEMLHFRIPLE